ncbi:MAG: hypothetical protein ACP5RW_09705 [bacterium]
MSVNNDKKDCLLAFLSIYEMSSNDGYIGSILVTDTQSIPLEFRCTHPIRPNIIQKTLYGDILERYIGVNLCGIPLLRSLQNSPSLLIVCRDFLLDIRKEVNYPVVYIRREEEIILTQNDSSILKREKFESPTGKFEPIILTFLPNFEDETVVKDILESVFYSFDPLEPFERMNKAINVLLKEDKRFQ